MRAGALSLCWLTSFLGWGGRGRCGSGCIVDGTEGRSHGGGRKPSRGLSSSYYPTTRETQVRAQEQPFLHPKAGWWKTVSSHKPKPGVALECNRQASPSHLRPDLSRAPHSCKTAMPLSASGVPKLKLALLATFLCASCSPAGSPLPIHPLSRQSS